jgi:hypothetical protein
MADQFRSHTQAPPLVPLQHRPRVKILERQLGEKPFVKFGGSTRKSTDTSLSAACAQHIEQAMRWFRPFPQGKHEKSTDFQKLYEIEQKRGTLAAGANSPGWACIF